MKTITIGTWHEPTAREFTRCPSYYAADTETLRILPGDYPVTVGFQGGYTVPMPYWIFAAMKTERVSGRLYNGCGGVNYSHVELKAGEPVDYTSQMYVYQLRELVASGRVTLNPGFAWLLDERPFQHADAPKDWPAVHALERVGAVA